MNLRKWVRFFFFFPASHATQRGLLPNSALCPCVPQGGSRADDIELPTVFSRRQSPSTHLHHFLFRLCLYMARRLGSFSFETVVKTDGRRPTVAPCKLTSIPRATVDRPERHRLSFFFFSFVLKSSDAYLRQNCAIHFSDDVIRRDDRNLVAFFFSVCAIREECDVGPQYYLHMPRAFLSSRMPRCCGVRHFFTPIAFSAVTKLCGLCT